MKLIDGVPYPTPDGIYTEAGRLQEAQYLQTYQLPYRMSSKFMGSNN